MNEILFITVTILALSLILLAVRLGRVWLHGIVIVFLLIANIFASKLSIAFGVTTSLAIPLYAAIFLATDTLSEHFGRKAGFQAVWMGFLAQACLAGFGYLIVSATSIGDPAFADALATVFGFIPRIVAGSFIAYLISQNFDVWFFHLMKKGTSGKQGLWRRNIFSTVVSQGIDTVVFLLIAFGGVLPNLWEFILTTWIIKIIVSLADTPFMYLTYRFINKSKDPAVMVGEMP